MEDTEGNNMVHFGIDTCTSSQLRSPRVPWDVFDYIMDFLQNDMSTLLACAQSCRQLHASSVLYIYRNVSIQTAQQCVSFENTIKNNPWIGASVRTLLLDKREQYTMPWVYNHLAMNLSASLPNCHTLMLAKIEDLWKERYFDNLTRFKSIRKLVMLGCAMAPQELYAFLGCFENLQELRIESFRELFAGRCKAHPVRFKPRLTRLRLDCENMPLSTLGNTFYRFILDTPTRDTLERISIMTYKTDLESTGNFLQSFGPERIVEVEVGFVRRYGFYGDDPLTIQDLLSLSYHTALEKLIFLDFTNPAVQLILESFSPQHSSVRRIKFYVAIYTFKEIRERVDHVAISYILLSNFPNLGEVCIAFRGDFELDDVSREYEMLYSELSERIKLKVVKVSSATSGRLNRFEDD